MQLKTIIKLVLEKNGWMLRKTNGLAWGIDLCLDLRRLNAGPMNVIFDIGAHRGETAQYFATRYPGASIHCFEPNSENFAHLKRNLATTQGVRCINVALGEQDGVAKMELFDDSQTHSLRHTLHAQGKPPVRVEDVGVTSVDRVMEQNDIARISMLKMDTEGFELQVLRGARTALCKEKVDFILLEASLDPDDHVHSSLLQIQRELAAFQYALVAIYDQVVWSPCRLAYFNALFARRSIAKAARK